MMKLRLKLLIVLILFSNGLNFKAEAISLNKSNIISKSGLITKNLVEFSIFSILTVITLVKQIQNKFSGYIQEIIPLDEDGMFIRKIYHKYNPKEFYFYLIKDNTKVIGQLGCILEPIYQEKSEGYLHTFYVDTEYRSNGYAKLLLKQTTQYLISQGIDKRSIYLHVGPFEKVNGKFVPIQDKIEVQAKTAQLLKLYCYCGFQLINKRNLLMVYAN